MQTDSGRTDIFGNYQRQATLAISLMIAFKIALIFVFAWHLRLVMDEFGQLGYAKYIASGMLFDTVQPSKALGFAVFYKLAHLLGWDAPSILLIGRLQTALLACATLGMLYATARTLGEDRLRALAIVLILLCFSNFSERIFRTRAEPLAVFFAVAALLVILRGQGIGAKRVLIAGILSGLSFLVTQKAAYFNLALGLGLVGDAFLQRRYLAGIIRGLWLVLGWLLSIVAYCFIFGGSDPLLVANSLVSGPLEVATRGSAEYGGLRHFVLQTLIYNPFLYLLCFSGMILALIKIKTLDERRRIALIFSLVITVLIFTHDQPWPYVFVMALPFMSLWSLLLLDRMATQRLSRVIVYTALVATLVTGGMKSFRTLQIDNRAQLDLVARAEALLEPDEKYFDGVGMLPNRYEPSTLWLDAHYVLATLHEEKDSEAYQLLTKTPPKLILWSYRMDNISRVIAPIVQNSYVAVSPNIRMVGHRLPAGQPEVFEVPIAGTYQLYSLTGAPLQGQLEIDGLRLDAPVELKIGSKSITLLSDSTEALLLPAGHYDGLLKQSDDESQLFEKVYY